MANSPSETWESAGALAHLNLSFLGPFEARFDGADPLQIKEKKARALLAMIVVAPKGVRSRQWLQHKLWSARGEKEGAASLRQTLSGLRRLLAPHGEVLTANRAEVRLDLDRVRVDLNNIPKLLDETPGFSDSEFLEGLDIADPEFEVWVQEQRAFWGEQLRRNAESRAPEAREARPQAAKPLPYLAVMPFSEDPSAPVPAHLAEGVADQIIDQMSKVKWIATISRGTLFSVERDELDPILTGQAVSADFVVAGTLHGGGKGYVLDLELIQLPKAIVIWRHKFTIETPATLAQVSDIAIEIAGNLSSSIGHAREQMSQTRGSDDDQISDLIWRGRWHMHRLAKDDFASARHYFDKAIAQDPGNADAHLYKALTNLWEVWIMRGSAQRLLEVRKQAHHAVTLDVADGRGYWIVGTAETWLRNFESAERYIEESIRLCPSLAFAYVQKGTLLTYSERPEQAMVCLEHALRLSPFDQQRFNFLGETAMAALMMGDNERARDMALQTLLLRPSYWYAHMIKALAHSRLGSPEKALAALRELFFHRPDFSSNFVRWLPFSDAERAEEIIEEIRILAMDLEEQQFR